MYLLEKNLKWNLNKAELTLRWAKSYMILIIILGNVNDTSLIIEVLKSVPSGALLANALLYC